MLKKYNRYLLLKVFLDSPLDSFRLREISRISGISPGSVMNYLREFQEDGLIERYEKRGVPFYKANRDGSDFVFYKRLSVLYELKDSGLIDYLVEAVSPRAIILYGSSSLGEDVEGSDIDIYIVGKEREVKLGKFEKRLGKEVHLMFKEDVKKISDELKSNLINGIVLYGYFEVFGK